MALGRLKFSGPIVTWLTGQRDPQGGFVSTQVCQYMPKNEMYLSILKKLIRIVRITSRDSIDIRFYTFCILLVYKALEFLVHTENHQRIMGKWAKPSIRPLLWNHFARAHKNFVHSLCDLYSFVLILLYENRNFFRQDTCVALQALSKYSEKTAGAKLDLRVSVSSEKDVNWKRKYHIDRGNALILRQEDVRLLSR